MFTVPGLRRWRPITCRRCGRPCFRDASPLLRAVEEAVRRGWDRHRRPARSSWSVTYEEGDSMSLTNAEMWARRAKRDASPPSDLRDLGDTVETLAKGVLELIAEVKRLEQEVRRLKRG